MPTKTITVYLVDPCGKRDETNALADLTRIIHEKFPGSYLAELFSSDLNVWFAAQVKDDGVPDLMSYLRDKERDAEEFSEDLYKLRQERIGLEAQVKALGENADAILEPYKKASRVQQELLEVRNERLERALSDRDKFKLKIDENGIEMTRLRRKVEEMEAEIERTKLSGVTFQGVAAPALRIGGRRL